jgi:hypothetical protein
MSTLETSHRGLWLAIIFLISVLVAALAAVAFHLTGATDLASVEMFGGGSIALFGAGITAYNFVDR